jgi:flavin reductase (DIM6/NTAB) family NADH-FMN oxidoreductase RutF
VTDADAEAGTSGGGPEDADAYDRRRRRVLWSMPSGLYVIGSCAELDGAMAWNLMTANLVVQVAVDPKAIAVAVESGARTAQLIAASHAFTVNLLARVDRAVVRRFVKPVREIELDDQGRPRVMAGERVHLASSGCPVLERAPAALDCALRQTLDLASHTLFVGEVLDVAGGVAPLPELLRMEDTRMSYGG